MSTLTTCRRGLGVSLLGALFALGCGDQGTAPPSQPEESPGTLSALSTLDIIVTTTSDAADFGGTHQVADLPGTDGEVSLREAITAANNTTGKQVIGFNIPTSDVGFDGTVFTIQPLSPHPVLSDMGGGTTIDGTTQATFSGQTNPSGPEIVLNGDLQTTDIPGDNIGLDINSANNIIRGLVINGFAEAGIRINDATAVANAVQGCFIGTNAAGSAAEPNIHFGVFIGGGASGNVIGGIVPGRGNLISGNQNTPFGAGVYIHSAGTDNRVVGNLIGTDRTGTLPIPNGEEGVETTAGASNTLIAGNIIAFNLHAGVAVSGDLHGVTVITNSIRSNANLGIDLGVIGNDGVTPNDPGDSDIGPNHLMNFPVLTSARIRSDELTVRGNIDTPNPRSVVIEFFANPVPAPGGDPSGHGEGALFLGRERPNGQGEFTAELRRVRPGTLISATATDAAGNTSEFSANIAAQQAPGGYDD